MRSWELNANEFLQLVRKAGKPAFLTAPTPKDVGRVAFTQLPRQRKDSPYAITDLGTIVYCAAAGKSIKLIGKREKDKVIEHEDGKQGEVFVASYFNRRIPKKELAKLKS